MKETESFAKLCEVMATLFSEEGCPWDKAQTHESLRPHLLEEAYEVADAIDAKDSEGLKEELGDLLYHVMMHSTIAEKNGLFNLAEVLDKATDKLITRHTHVFGNDVASTGEAAVETWEANKLKEKGIRTPLENMKAVPKALPALSRAEKVIKRSKKDFEAGSTLDEIHGLLDELFEADSDIGANMEKSGKILLLLTAFYIKKEINAEFSLTNATQAFINSF